MISLTTVSKYPLLPFSEIMSTLLSMLGRNFFILFRISDESVILDLNRLETKTESPQKTKKDVKITDTFVFCSPAHNDK